jgi:DNA gyrase subunit B
MRGVKVIFLFHVVAILALVAGFRSSTHLVPGRRLTRQARRATTIEPPATGDGAENKESILSKVNSDYDAGAITVLEGLDPVRKRPGMYIGSTGQRGLHHLVFEIVDNSVDESLAGHCSEITVTLNDNGSVEVMDNGRGIPTGIHPVTGKSALETVLCVLHAGGKFGGDDSGYKVSGGLHGVGVSVVNALSSALTCEVTRESKLHRIAFKAGIPQTDLEVSPITHEDPNRKSGTRVVFQPDPIIFKTTLHFDFDKIATRVDELAYLNAGLTLTMIDKRSKANRKKGQKVTADLAIEQKMDTDNQDEDGMEGEGDKKKKSLINAEEEHEENIETRTEVYRHDGGISELVETLCADKLVLHPTNPIISASVEKKGVNVEVALRWSKDQYTESLTGFANGIRTIDGGTHIDGLKASISKVLNASLRKAGKLKEKDGNVPGEYCREGLTAVVSVKVPEPEFEGQTKTRLGNPEVREIVDSVVKETLMTLFDWHPDVLAVIGNKAMQAQAAAAAAKAAREMVRRKSLLQSTVLPGKLADCSSRDPKDSEIYVVEGDSAAGSAKQGRDRMTQAILPLRGKILNIEKASNDKIYSNNELQALISALGLGVRGAPFDENSLRYHRIVIMTDADVDGSHIRILLLTFLYRYCPELITRGYVYIACPPLYKVNLKGGGKASEKYLFDQGAMDEYLKGVPAEKRGNVQQQRFKGLGEMMPQQLWETTMDPERRTLRKVTVEDASAADRLFTVLMGDNVLPRKEFITENAESMRLSDLDF